MASQERKVRWLGKQKQESLKRIREAKAASLRRHIQQLTPDQAIARGAANAASRRRHIQQLTPYQAFQAFQGFPKWSVLILICATGTHTCMHTITHACF